MALLIQPNPGVDMYSTVSSETTRAIQMVVNNLAAIAITIVVAAVIVAAVCFIYAYRMRGKKVRAETFVSP